MLARIPWDVWIALLAAIGTVFAAIYEIWAFAALGIYVGLGVAIVMSVIGEETKL